MPSYPVILPPAIFLMGPTAAGKSDLALDLARRYACEIISVDSALVYRGMDIGTAKPATEVLAGTPHHLIDICEPTEAYSAGRFHEDALREMAAITTAGRIPLLVGGTMLYFRALQQGLGHLPTADAAIRGRLEDEARQFGWQHLHNRLTRVDPEAAGRIHPNDPQRIQRALEVFELCGVPLSELCRRQSGTLPYRPIKIVVAPTNRGLLHERISQRYDRMLASGFVEEVQGLRRRHILHPGLPSMRAVGYRQVWEYLDGQTNYEEMRERAIIATRQLAKRQWTWLRSETGAAWFDSGTEGITAKVAAFVDAALSGR